MPDHPREAAVRTPEIRLDPASDAPLYRQIVDQVWVDVASGALETGARLPTVRQLAIDLGVHPDTVARAYNELELLGVILRRGGEGTFVGLKPPLKAEIERRARLDKLCRDVMKQAEEIGFSLDDLIDMLTDMRSAPHSAVPPKRTQ